MALGSNTLCVTYDVRIMLQGNLGVAVAHHPGNDVDWRAGLEQLCRHAMPERMNSDVDAFRGHNPKFHHRSVNA
ncbi:MAG TPA: hypothetical protein VM709_14305 [Candidatus Sulfotelmatobacter sp.]|nr:hypothetical protein [Candidatus Sulfotelmatobacter sp.]